MPCVGGRNRGSAPARAMAGLITLQRTTAYHRQHVPAVLVVLAQRSKEQRVACYVDIIQGPVAPCCAQWRLAASDLVSHLRAVTEASGRRNAAQETSSSGRCRAWR